MSSVASADTDNTLLPPIEVAAYYTGHWPSVFALEATLFVRDRNNKNNNKRVLQTLRTEHIPAPWAPVEYWLRVQLVLNGKATTNETSDVTPPAPALRWSNEMIYTVGITVYGQDTMYLSANDGSKVTNCSIRLLGEPATGTGSRAESSVALAHALRENPSNPSLQNLDLKNNHLWTDGPVALADALRVNQSLQKLGFENCHLGTDGAVALADALRVNQSLQKLDLKRNNIGDSVAVALAEALRVNQSLQELNLDNNQVGTDGAVALADALRVNQWLQKLILKVNNIGVDGAVALVDALRVNETLRVLDLENESIRVLGQVGALRFIEPIRSSYEDDDNEYNSEDNNEDEIEDEMEDDMEDDMEDGMEDDMEDDDKDGDEDESEDESEHNQKLVSEIRVMLGDYNDTLDELILTDGWGWGRNFVPEYRQGRQSRAPVQKIYNWLQSTWIE
jgi:Ran GTPase-activating protein (RanGAP) involved in mRNA processing and transport